MCSLAYNLDLATKKHPYDHGQYHNHGPYGPLPQQVAPLTSVEASLICQACTAPMGSALGAHGDPGEAVAAPSPEIRNGYRGESLSQAR